MVGSIKARRRPRLVGRHQAKPLRILSAEGNEGNSRTSVATPGSKMQRLEILSGLLLLLLHQTLRPSDRRHLSLLSAAAVLATLHQVLRPSVVTQLRRLLPSEILLRLHLRLLEALMPLHQLRMEYLLRPRLVALRLQRILPRLVVDLLLHLLRLVAQVAKLKLHLLLGDQHQVHLPSVVVQRLLPRLSVVKHLVLHQ